MIEKTLLRLLSAKNMSSMELKEKLYQKGFSKLEVDSLVQEYCDKGYLNDEDLALYRAHLYKKRGYGLRWIRLKLKQQGLKVPDQFQDHIEDIKIFLSKTSFKNKTQKSQIAALERRGFDLDMIFKALFDFKK